MTRRTAARLIACAPLLPLGAQTEAPKLAPGAPESTERMALVNTLRAQCEPLGERFEVRKHKPVEGWAIPYRLFRPSGGAGKLPLVLYLHGAGGLGSDNRKHLEGGNLFGARVWATEANQKRNPCFVVAPQTDRGWIRYEGMPGPDGRPPRAVAGLGVGARAAVDLVEALVAEFPIDAARVYVTGNSMGGGGSWHVVAHRPGLIAAAVPVCGSTSLEDGGQGAAVPLWNFHGDADKTVPVEVSRRRIEQRRKAGGKPIATEYAGVGHNVSLWAYSEPALLDWVFAQRKKA